MSPEPGVEWTQETNSPSHLVIVDALIKWTGECWRVITRVSFNILPTKIYHYSYEYSLYCISIVASPAAPWFTELCLCWHLLNSHGLLQIPLHLSVYVCVYMCAEEKQREIIASLREERKLFNIGAHGGKTISNNVLFLQQQLCLTPMASAAHYESSHLFLHRLPPCLDIHRQ